MSDIDWSYWAREVQQGRATIDLNFYGKDDPRTFPTFAQAEPTLAQRTAAIQDQMLAFMEASGYGSLTIEEGQ